MPRTDQKTRRTVVAALAQNRGELDPARLTALLERLGPPAPAKPAPAA